MKSLSFVLMVFVASTGLAGNLVEEVFAEINHARTNPRAYAEIVAATGSRDTSALREAVAFLRGSRPIEPLYWSDAMSAGAVLHVRAQGPSGGVGHRGQPRKRLEKFGVVKHCAGENIYYGRGNAREIVVALIIDSGVRGRGHRKNLFSRDYSVIGIADGRHARFGGMCVMDFAGGFVADTRPAVIHQIAQMVQRRGSMF